MKTYNELVEDSGRLLATLLFQRRYPLRETYTKHVQNWGMVLAIRPFQQRGPLKKTYKKLVQNRRRLLAALRRGIALKTEDYMHMQLQQS